MGLPLIASYYGDAQGTRDERWLYGSCTRVVLPSEFACSASGLPVIVANRYGRHEALVDGITGHLCHGDSERDFAWRTAELLANAPRRAAMAVRAAAYAKRRPASR